jgi:hypothetical protein
MNEIIEFIRLLKDLKDMCTELDDLMFRSIQQFLDLDNVSINQRIITVNVKSRPYRVAMLVSGDGVKLKCVDVTWEGQIYTFNKVRIDIDQRRSVPLRIHLIDGTKLVDDMKVHNLNDVVKLTCNIRPEDLDEAIANTNDEEAKKVLERLKTLISITKDVLNL